MSKHQAIDEKIHGIKNVQPTIIAANIPISALFYFTSASSTVNAVAILHKNDKNINVTVIQTGYHKSGFLLSYISYIKLPLKTINDYKTLVNIYFVSFQKNYYHHSNLNILVQPSGIFSSAIFLTSGSTSYNLSVQITF